MGRLRIFERFPADFLLAIALAISLAVWPMTWWLKVLLLIALATILAELVWRIHLPRGWKVGSIPLIGLTVAVIGYGPVVDQYHFDSVLADYKAKRDLVAKFQDREASLKRIVGQYDRLRTAQSLFDSIGGKFNGEQYAEIDRASISDIKNALDSVELVVTPIGDVLKIKLGPNLYRIINPVPMVKAPSISFFSLPAGVSANVVERTNLGITVLFTPLSTRVDHFDMTASADF